MMDLEAVKRTALEWLEANHDQLSRDHLAIWEMAEPAWREYRSCAWYVDRLRAAGWTVEEGSATMPTAFCATWGEAGPVLGGYAEYDAVPGRSQAAVPYRQPRPGMSKYAAGHTDPHSGLGIGALAGFLAAQHALKTHGIKARLKFLGEPAEKMCGSKPVHAAHGYYDDMDAAISFHPASFGGLVNSVLWDTHCAPYWSRIYTFECDDPETWLARQATAGIQHTHGVARAPGTIDAVVLMYTASKFLKEAMLPHNGGWSINEFIMTAGQAAADNLAPNIGQIQYACRAPFVEMQEKVFATLDNNADHAAAISHCTVRKEWITKTRPGLPNHALADITYRNFERVGPPKWSEAGKAFGREIQKTLGIAPMDDPFPPEHEQLTTPQDGEAWFRANLPAWQKNFAADDYVEYTWHAPTVRLYVARPILRSPEPGYRYPEWTRFAMGGTPGTIDPMWSTAGKVIALTLVDLGGDPAALERCKAEFRERTGGGIGGTRWMPPLLPEKFPAPVEYRWPEYVETVRGREWSIPTTTAERG